MRRWLTYTLIGIPFLAGYLILSSMLQTTAWIWYLTRAFGLLSFLALFATIALGELRLLSMPKGKLKIFKYHTPIAVFTTLLVLLHFIAAAFDKYKWGIGLTIKDYLGFSFGDKWLALLSLGMLATYLLILVGMTSRKPAMRKLGFKKWKLVHLLSYVSFIFAYVHSVNLGTDIKTSSISPFVHPVMQFAFWTIIALLAVRLLASFKLFSEQSEITLTAAFAIVLIVGGVFTTTAFFTIAAEQPPDDQGDPAAIQAEIAYYEQANSLLATQSSAIQSQLSPNGGG